MRFFRISHILLTSSLGAWVQLLDAHPMEIEKELSGSHSEREIPPILPDLNSPTTSEPNVPFICTCCARYYQETWHKERARG
ncbi:hypothetical protein PCANC_01498 [Puccinia coronata f. sp. avenae]|uniref:Secreted protein n=1 Tax=Puccinia coronata f. sp. avenae TaxID=200324 RepID=A0A2N5W2X5_9BASI|nr:hypothetical protein PCANC_01498 [Puccinia coronata f. sp. avenae]